MTENIYQQYLSDCLKQQNNNIQSHTLPNGEVVWVRRSDAHHSMWIYRLMGIFTTVLRADALTPVPSLGGQTAIQNEARTLQRLSSAGIIVPKLLAVCDDGLMMTDLSDSQTLRATLSRSKDKLADWQRGVVAIAELHNKQQYVSQCFSRNMISFNDGRIGFIDFEDAPEKVLTLAQCQTRDWLCFLFSTLLYIDTDDYREQAVTIFRQSLGENTDSVINDMYTNTRFLQWTKRLYHRRWGRDTLRIASLMRFIEASK
ncbi:MAG: hypothetical protein KGV56_00800 [Gammaproteobacteria bacterium]|nr:hypothetical protein [Gammaproteobacteria bacterium]